MKKLLFFVMAIAYSTLSYADDDDWGYYPQPQINNYYPPQPQAYNYYPQPQVNNYYPAPQVNNYYPQPQANYYPPQPQYYGYNQRSHQGLAGSVIGDVLGYELGNGNPLASGIGAAAGTILGNGFGY